MSARQIRALALLAAGAAACSDGVELPLEAQPEDLVVVVATVEGRTEATVVRPEAGRSVRVRSDPDRPIYTWRIAPADQVDANGDAITAALVDGTSVRFVEDPPPDGTPGACGRCAAPTLSPPIVVHAGDSCPVPTFAAGAVWTPDGGKYACAGSANSPLCPEAGAEALAEIEAVRRRLRLERPGDCACSAAPPRSLSGLRIEPLAPATSPHLLNAFAENSAGQIAGFGRSGVLLWDPTSGSSRSRALDGYEATVKTAVALRDGDFLVSGNAFNSGSIDQQDYFRFSVSAGGLSDPVLVEPTAPILAERMRYLGGPEARFPLYLAGGVRGTVGVEPALFACTDNRLACQQVTLTTCPDRPGVARLGDAQINAAGFGIALAHDALYYKTSNPAGISEQDDWRCGQPEGPYPTALPDAPTVSLSGYRTVGQYADRFFVCGQTQEPACTPSRAVVLTATAAATDPNWQVAYVGPPDTRCGEFLPRAGGVALYVTGLRVVDFDAAGTVVGEVDLFERYGPLDGFKDVRRLGTDRVLARGTENRLFVATSSEAFSAIYGTEARVPRDNHAAVPRPGGGFYVFGGNPGPVLVDPAANEVRTLEDPQDILQGTVFAAVVHGPSTRDAVPVVLGGEAGGGPRLVQATLTPTGFEGATVIELPSDMRPIRHLAVVAGQVLIGTVDTRLWALHDGQVQAVDMRWDDPTASGEQRRPAPPVDGCSGQTGNLDLFRSLTGAQGVGWAAGADDLLFQITAEGPGRLRAERYPLPPNTNLSTGRSSCVADTWLGGRSAVVNAAGFEDVRFRLFALSPLEEPRRGEAPGPELDPRRQCFPLTAADEIDAVNIFAIIFGRPVTLLPDVQGNGDATVAAVLDNGLVFRVAAGRRIEYLRAPFSPRMALQDDQGRVLFLGEEGRLALGTPP